MTMHELAAFLESHYLLSSALLIVIVLLLIIETLRAKSNIYKLSPLQVTQSINREKATVIDIRPADIYSKGHIIGALSIPLTNLDSQIKKIEKLKAKPIIIICESIMPTTLPAVCAPGWMHNCHLSKDNHLCLKSLFILKTIALTAKWQNNY